MGFDQQARFDIPLNLRTTTVLVEGAKSQAMSFEVFELFQSVDKDHDEGVIAVILNRRFFCILEKINLFKVPSFSLAIPKVGAVCGQLKTI